MIKRIVAAWPYILVWAVVLYWHYALWLYIQRLRQDPITRKLWEEN